MDLDLDNFKVQPPGNFKLSSFISSSPLKPFSKAKLRKMLENDRAEISDLQYKLYAENRQSLLILFQGMDSSGKDSAIKNVMQGVNPQGVTVHSFKHPSNAELRHGYLWRHYQKLPEKGQIVIFNRSHYENVLISKVHPEIVLAELVYGIDDIDKVDSRFWLKRYEQINKFEEIVLLEGTHILKLFLHISKKEQAARFLTRIENKEKHWKFSSEDIKERNYWDEYHIAYQDAIKFTSTGLFPWHIIPADDKWFAHLLIGKLILKKLKEMAPVFPPLTRKEKVFMKNAEKKLRREI